MALTADPRIQKIITVSSPLLGTQVADYMPLGVVGTDLNYQNPNLVQTANLLQSHSHKLYHIVVIHDHIIIPATSGQYDHTPPSQIYTYSGKYNHCCLFDDPILVARIIEWL